MPSRESVVMISWLQTIYTRTSNRKHGTICSATSKFSKMIEGPLVPYTMVVDPADTSYWDNTKAESLLMYTRQWIQHGTTLALDCLKSSVRLLQKALDVHSPCWVVLLGPIVCCPHWFPNEQPHQLHKTEDQVIFLKTPRISLDIYVYRN